MLEFGKQSKMAKQLVKQNFETHDTRATEQITATNSSN